VFGIPPPQLTAKTCADLNLNSKLARIDAGERRGEERPPKRPSWWSALHKRGFFLLQRLCAGRGVPGAQAVFQQAANTGGWELRDHWLIRMSNAVAPTPTFQSHDPSHPTLPLHSPCKHSPREPSVPFPPLHTEMAAATQTLERLPLSASQRLDSQNGADQDRMQLAATTRATQSNQSLAPRRETGTVESGSATADITKVNLPDQGCSWDDVLSSIEATRDEYERKTGKNRLRAMPRSQVIVTTLHGLTEMIPEQDGLSILRGGLKLIFGVCEFTYKHQMKGFKCNLS